jgi:Tfp pilus assembly protein PilV
LRCRLLAHDQGGFALIEVMVSAMLVAMLSVGVLAGFDAAGSTSGSNKSRSIASGLAQDDQERIRSLAADDAAARRSETRTVDVAGITYSVQSLIRPVADAGTGGCGDGRLLKISSLVTWPKMNGLKTVRSDSFVAPKAGSFGAGEGGLVITVRNRSGAPQPGVTISIAGPKSDSDTTDENGCGSFLYVPKGTYTATVSKSGYVASDGQASKAVTAPEGAVGKATFDYDAAGQITANVVTMLGANQVADESTSLTVSHSSLPAPGTSSKAASPPASSISTGMTLFPFTSSYSVYSGTCAGANPQNFPPETPASALLTAGASATVTVFEPSVNVTVKGPTGTALQGATVKATDKTCGGALTFTNATNAAGQLPKPGMPYGNYDVCAQASVGSPLTLRHVTNTAVTNILKAGTAPFTLQITTTSPLNGCP